jgi:hypothetical protein
MQMQLIKLCVYLLRDVATGPIFFSEHRNWSFDEFNEIPMKVGFGTLNIIYTGRKFDHIL